MMQKRKCAKNRIIVVCESYFEEVGYGMSSRIWMIFGCFLKSTRARGGFFGRVRSRRAEISACSFLFTVVDSDYKLKYPNCPTEIIFRRVKFPLLQEITLMMAYAGLAGVKQRKIESVCTGNDTKIIHKGGILYGVRHSAGGNVVHE